MRFNLTFLRGPIRVAEVKGILDFGKKDAEKISAIALDSEKFLEQLTGLRVHVTTEEK